MSLNLIQKAMVITVFLAVVLAGFYAAIAKCPPCVKRVLLEAGERHGTNAGRRIVKVCITGSWDSSPGQTDTRVWNAVTGAVNDWNSATTAAGQTIPYFFVLDQSSLNNDCTIPIVKKDTATCAEANLSINHMHNPPVGVVTEIRMPAGTVGSMGTAGLKAAFSHEFGHAIGLSGAIGACCPAGSLTTADYSIMTTAFGGCASVYTHSVQARDVSQVRQQFDDSLANCTLTATGVMGFPDMCPDPCEDPSCPGFDEVTCANSSDTSECGDDSGGCTSVWEVTNYYLCNGSGCTYLYSDWVFLGIDCSVTWFDPCA